MFPKCFSLSQAQNLTKLQCVAYTVLESYQGIKLTWKFLTRLYLNRLKSKWRKGYA